jgi:hypothetical protein
MFLRHKGKIASFLVILLIGIFAFSVVCEARSTSESRSYHRHHKTSGEKEISNVYGENDNDFGW